MFLYISDQVSEREIKKNPTYNCIETNKILGNKVNQEGKDLHLEHCMTRLPWQSNG